MAKSAKNTDAWLVKADTCALPQEDIPLLSQGDSGESYGWPAGLMGVQSTARLRDMGITTTSSLIKMANGMDLNSWKRLFGSRWGNEGEQNAVWPKRYANVYSYLLRVIQNNPENAREYKKRLANIPNLMDAATGRTTAAWAIFADTQKLPEENIPKELGAGQAGGHYGWPNGLMGNVALAGLHKKGIAKASQLFQKGVNMDHAAFCAEFESVFTNRVAGAHMYLSRAVLCNAENLAEFRRRGGSVRGGDQNGLIASAVIFIAALLASFFANDTFLSHLASLAVCSVGIYVVTKQSPGICMCLGAYAVIAQILATFTFTSAVAAPIFLLFIYIFVEHHDKLPSVLIPSMFR
jgi:hypothetical protein